MKKLFLFSFLAVFLAGAGFGGISMAENVAQIDGGSGYDTLQAAIAAAQDGDTVILLDDVTLNANVGIDKSINIDLGGKTINANGNWFYFNGNVTSEISSGTINNTNLPAIQIQGGANVTINGGVYTSSSNAVQVNASTVTIKDGNYTSVSNTAVWTTGATVVIESGNFIGGFVAIGDYNNSDITVSNGTFEGVEAAVHFKTKGRIDIENGIFKATDNCVLRTQGNEGLGENVINVANGEFNGFIETNGFIACGIYVANNDTVTVNGGTFNVPNGVGIVARGGITNVSKDVVFDVSSNESLVGKVGDSNIRVPNNKEVVIDLASGYPGSNEGDFKVTAENVTVVEGATPTQYDVKFAEGNNTLTVKKANDILVVDTVTAEEGYKWYNGDETSPYVFNSAITDNVTLTSKINTYTINFDADVKGVDNPAEQTVNHGDKANEPEVTNTGNILLGWFNGDDKFDFETQVTSNLSLKAKWEAMTSSGGAKIDDESDEGTGMVVEADVPATETDASAVQSSNSTATVQGEVELNVYNDADLDGNKDGDPILTRVNFTSPVLVRIPVNSGSSAKVKVKHNGDNTFGTEGLTTSSTATCNNGVSNVPYNGGDIAVTSGYVEIYTCSASTFVAYTEVTNPTSSSTSGGGGGGGSSSSSCKSLPSNAVANNTKKPSSSTNYFYDTDTTKVCSFVCKKGYEWVEKTSKCEAVTVTTTTTTGDTADTSKAEENKSDIDNNTNTTEDWYKDSDNDGTLDNGLSKELVDAYIFSHDKGITTMNNPIEADMFGPLNRIAMAKMLSQYAINVLGKTPDTSRVVPAFPDVDEQLNKDYNDGVTLAYQLGIMGINIDSFRPFDLVTRAEFGTALSRMLFGLSDGEEDLWYKPHLDKLMNEKIITIDTPDLQELRGYVMIMLMRSAQ